MDEKSIRVWLPGALFALVIILSAVLDFAGKTIPDVFTWAAMTFGAAAVGGVVLNKTNGSDGK